MNDKIDNIELLLNRRSCKAIELIEPAPSKGELEEILIAAMRVPDHGKLAPWRISVLGSGAQDELGELFSAEYKKSYPDAEDKHLQFERGRPKRAPLLIAVTSRIIKEHKIPEIEQLLSCGAVCQNLLVAIAAKGYNAQWLTEWPAYNTEVKKYFGCKEYDHIVGFIYIGTAKEKPQERVRPEFSEIVEFNE